MSDVYKGVAVLTAIPIFLAAWIYFIAEQGLFWGLALGWVPAAILAAVACWAWPAVLIGACVAACVAAVTVLPPNVLNVLGYALVVATGAGFVLLLAAQIYYPIKKAHRQKTMRRNVQIKSQASRVNAGSATA